MPVFRPDAVVGVREGGLRAVVAADSSAWVRTALVQTIPRANARWRI